MVIYDLICEFDHTFEGWFDNADDFVAQQDSGLLTCPYCNSSTVTKQAAAPHVGKKSNSTNTNTNVSPDAAGNNKLAHLSKENVSESSRNVAIGGGATANPQAFAKLQKMLGKVHDYIDNNFTDVGNRFTEEAISIHNGEKEPENIRGTASKEQLKELADEGVQALPVPNKPIDKDKLN